MRLFGTFSEFNSFRKEKLSANRYAIGATIGNFDGMHRGHQALFGTLARELRGDRTSYRVLITFRPHPRQVLQGICKNELESHEELWELQSFRRKFEIAKEFGFDAFVALRFTKNFASTPARKFIENGLVDSLGTELVVVGHDWSFGKDREGSIDALQQWGDKFGFRTLVVKPFLEGYTRVSTGAIKEALAAGELGRANELLGRRLTISERVRTGDNRGEGLGFKTANLRFPHQVLPSNGVYATFAHYNGTRHRAATNIGIRPTFGGSKRLVEVHLLEGEHQLYGKRLSVEFVQRLRDEKRFSSPEELQEAIQADIVKTNEILSDPSL